MGFGGSVRRFQVPARHPDCVQPPEPPEQRLLCGWGFTEICSGSEAGSYLRLIDFVYHSTLGLTVMKKKKFAVVGLGFGVFILGFGALGV